MTRAEFNCENPIFEASEFHHICCNLTGQACASPLLTAINAGADALPTLLKLASVLAAKGQDWDRMPQLPLELNLGREYTFHSIFACPVHAFPEETTLRTMTC